MGENCSPAAAIPGAAETRREPSQAQRAWQAQERASRALLTPEAWWRNRRTGWRVQITGIEGIRVRYRSRPTRRHPTGEVELEAVNFLRTCTPISQDWIKAK